MLGYHVHQWQVRREWADEGGRLLRHRTCDGCTIEQQVRCVIAEMIWALFSAMGSLNQGPVFDRRRHYVERVIS
jgi:hypothetical protein